MPATLTSSTLIEQLRLRLRWHRRGIAAALAALALLSLGRSVIDPRPPSVPALIAARDLPAGRTLAADDLRLAQLPLSAVPASAVPPGDPPVGRVLTLPMASGEVLTHPRVLAPGLLAALGPDAVAAPVPLADASAVGLLRVGDTVDVLAAGESGSAVLAAESARVLVAPRDGPSSVVVLAVPAATARGLARAAVLARLSVVLRAP